MYHVSFHQLILNIRHENHRDVSFSPFWFPSEVDWHILREDLISKMAAK